MISKRGVGGAPPTASHEVTSPLQASIARRVTWRGRPCLTIGAGSVSIESAVTASLQQFSPAAADGACGSCSSLQQLFAFSGRSLSQQSPCGFRSASSPAPSSPAPSMRASSEAMSEPSSRCRRAKARRSASVVQQQSRKHWSAVAQPQGLFMQGNGTERSLAAIVPAASSPGDAPVGPLPAGNGNPRASTPYPRIASHVRRGRMSVDAAMATKPEVWLDQFGAGADNSQEPPPR